MFDVAAKFLLIDVESNNEVRREERQLPKTDSPARISEFLNFGAETLICGAISAPVEARLIASGVQVIGFTCGMVDEVLAAYLKGGLANQVFVMPGCRRWRRQEGEDVMPKGFGMGAGRGGRGRGQGCGQAAGRIGGPFTTGPGGFCLCPKCGEKTSHPAGQPCLRMMCPKCGTPMTRS